MAFTLLVLDEDAREYGALLRGVEGNFVVAEARNADEATETLPRADGLVTFGHMVDEAMIARAPRLKWLQALSSGTDNLLRLASLKPEVVVTSAAGIHGPMVSELAMLLMLAAARRLPELMRQQVATNWIRLPGQVLAGKTVGIAGMGVIGRALAAKCKAFDMRVVGFGAEVRAEDSVSVFHAYRDLVHHVGQLDVLVMLAPLRADTMDLVNHRVLSAMKPESILVNVGRGRTVNEADLIAALKQGQIGAAALDAHAAEPLPPDSPLWRLENAIITPHVAGYVTDYAARVAPIVAHNLRFILTGEHERLINRVPRRKASDHERLVSPT